MILFTKKLLYNKLKQNLRAFQWVSHFSYKFKSYSQLSKRYFCHYLHIFKFLLGQDRLSTQVLSSNILIYFKELFSLKWHWINAQSNY